MRRIILSLFLGLLFIVSCKKDQKQPAPQPPAGKVYGVNFNVAGYTKTSSGSNKQINALRAAINALPASVKVINYRATNSLGLVVSDKVQLRGADGFGVIADSLFAGTYTIDLFAGGEDFYIGKGLVTKPGWFQLGELEFWDDSFATTFNLVVGTEDISREVSLHRVVGMFTVNLTDVIPSKAHSIKVQLDIDNNTYYFGSDGTVNTGVEDGADASDRGKVTILPTPGISNFSENYFVLSDGDFHTVTISAFDADKNLIAQRKVTNVLVKRNTNTILTGKLFDTQTGGGVNIDQQWDTPTIIEF